MLALITAQSAPLELAAGLQSTHNSATFLPVAPITAINFLLFMIVVVLLR
jgi:hypothetical protein